MITTNELKRRFVEYMQNVGYNPIKPDSLVNETFPTCFTVSGGPNFVDRYLKQEIKEPENSVVVQPCHRFWDVENVGDKTHLSFFEMCVTTSFNGKSREAEYRSHFDFLTKELGLNSEFFTVFVFGGGDCYGKQFEADEEALEIWRSLGLTRYSIHAGFGYCLGASHKRLVNSSFVANNVEPVGGPRSEICYGDLEIWTSVHYNTFVRYDKEKNKFNFEPIQESTIAAGFGLERVIQAVNGLDSIHEIYSGIDSNPLVADHIRGLVFLASQGAFGLSGRKSSSRRTVLNRYVESFFKAFGNYDSDRLHTLVKKVVEIYEPDFPELAGKENEIFEKIAQRAKRLSKKC